MCQKNKKKYIRNYGKFEDYKPKQFDKQPNVFQTEKSLRNG